MEMTYLAYILSHCSCLRWPDAVTPIALGSCSSVAYRVTIFENLPDAETHGYNVVPLHPDEVAEIERNGEAGFWALHDIDPRSVIIALLCLWIGDAKAMELVQPHLRSKPPWSTMQINAAMLALMNYAASKASGQDNPT
jgi:hypothetical protein